MCDLTLREELANGFGDVAWKVERVVEHVDRTARVTLEMNGAFRCRAP